ncbi:DUF4169 family protein [Bradyrhizobium sp. USDA 3364]
MGDVVNLKRFKKRTEREQAAKQAETNRALFGRTKAERARDEFLGERNARQLNQHILDQQRIESGDAS